MSDRLHRVVRALIETLVIEPLGDEGLRDEAALAWATDAMVRRVHGMPSFLAPAMALLVVAFDGFGLLVALRRFHRQRPDQRARQIALWRRAPFGTCQAFVRFFEKMGTFLYLSRIEDRFEGQLAAGWSTAPKAQEDSAPCA